MSASIDNSQGEQNQASPQPHPAEGDHPSRQSPANGAEGGHRASAASPPNTLLIILQVSNTFKEKSVRFGFIRVVFAILALQMAVTVGLSCVFIFHKPTKDFVQENTKVYIAAYVLFFVLYIVLVCRTKCVARSYPCNMILLGVFTLSLAYMVAAISSFHDTKIALMVFVIAFGVCCAVIIFTCQTKYDFTTSGSLLFVLLLSLLLFGIFAGIFVPIGGIEILDMVYAGGGALLFMGFLALDTQLIMAGKLHKIDPENYVFAAMMLYANIAYIIMFLLSLFGGSN